MLDANDNLINEAFAQVPIVKDYLEAKEKRGETQTRDQREDTVYNHLYIFFSRYYENGDFIPRRRYSQTERYTVHITEKKSTSTGQTRPILRQKRRALLDLSFQISRHHCYL